MVHAGFLYLFGARHDSEHGWGIRVGRVRFKDLLDRDEWQFWDGKTWNYDARKAKPVLENAAPHFSVHWNAFLRRYVAVFSVQNTNDVMLTTASDPTGPWVQPILLTKVKADSLRSATAHRELQLDNGRVETIAVSCVVNGKIQIKILQVSFQEPTIPQEK